MYALADICKTDMKFIKNLRQKSFEGKNFMQKTCNSPYLLTCNKGVSTSSFRWCDLWKLLVFTLDCIKDGFLKNSFGHCPNYYHPHPLSCQPPPLQQFSSVLYQLRQIWSLLSAAPLCVSSVAADKKRLNQMSTLQYMSPVFRISREVMWKCLDEEAEATCNHTSPLPAMALDCIKVSESGRVSEYISSSKWTPFFDTFFGLH